jgi:nicotinamidase-related amidase
VDTDVVEKQEFATEYKPFLQFLDKWFETLPQVRLKEIVDEAGGPAYVSVVCIDLTNCFCKVGPLASPRIHALIQPIVELFELAYSTGIRNFMLTKDVHPPDSPEFEAYGPHCIAGTSEVEIVDELKNLPFADLFVALPKQTINPATSIAFLRWLEEQVHIKRFIVVGDCTDICVYQAAMYIKTHADQYHTRQKVIVPANCVNTFDLPAEVFSEGKLPHDGELLNRIFLYHMALNNIQVVSRLIG